MQLAATKLTSRASSGLLQRAANLVCPLCGLEAIVVGIREIVVHDPGPPSAEFSFEVLSTEQLSKHARNTDLEISAEFIEKSESRGDLCVGALNRGRLVAYTWFGTGAPAPFRPGLEITYAAPGQVYAYKSFTLPDYRGQRLQAHVGQLANRILLERGYDRVLGYINVTNKSSLRMLRKFKEARNVGYAVVMEPWSNPFFYVTAGARAVGFGFRRT